MVEGIKIMTFAEKCALAQQQFISCWMFIFNRQYIIDKVKRPLIKAIIALATRYPEPTKERTAMPNTHKLLDIRDKFFRCENNPGRDSLLQSIWRIFIVEYEHDKYYRDRIDWVIEEINKSDWKLRDTKSLKRCWKE